MPEETKDVQVDSSATTEVVNEGVETTEQEATTAENVQQQAPTTNPEVVKEEGEVDEKGVPYKNRYMEAQRKLHSIQSEYQGLQSTLPNLIQEAVAKAIPQQQASPTYSKEDLIKFKNTAESPEHRSWAEIELEKLRSKETEEYFKNQTQAKERQMKFEQERQAAYGYVASNYGVMLNPDGSWNNDNPLTQKLARIISSDETLRNHPSGLRVAADMAVAEHLRETQPEMMKQTNKLKRQVKKLQSATQIEGNGQPQTLKQPNPMKSAMERLARTGDKDSSKAVAAELIKLIHPNIV